MRFPRFDGVVAAGEVEVEVVVGVEVRLKS